MLYKRDFEQLEPYYRAFWACEVLDRPALSVTAPRDPGQEADWSWSQPSVVAQQSPEWLLDRFERQAANTFYGGLACPAFSPNFGPDVFSGFLGVPMHYSPDSTGTSWIDWKAALLASYDGLAGLAIRDDNEFFRRNRELTRYALDRGRGKYITGLTDLHGGFDSLCVLRGGPDRASMDLIEFPDQVKAAMRILFTQWRKVYDDFRSLAAGLQQGTTSWIGIYAPGAMYPVQNDFSCLVSAASYREFFLEELRAEIDYLDYSIYHLDGVEALQHLDTLLDIPRLNAVQWVRGARWAAEGLAKWIPLYRRIQERRKAIVVYCEPVAVTGLIEQLKPEGLLLQVACATIEEARELLKKHGWGGRDHLA